VPYLLGKHPIVASDAQLGALPSDVCANALQIGSLALPDDRPLDSALVRFLESGEPPIYAGFGSMPDSDPRLTTRIILEGAASVRRRVVLASGWAGLGEGAMPSGVHVTHSPNHALLLPRVRLAVHHGGAGTTAAVARAGVPHVVVPHLADQFYWGQQVHCRGLGSRPIPRSALNAARLARAIGEVLEDEAMAGQARKVAAALTRTNGTERLVDHLEAIGARVESGHAA
jgi:UDP:flavonoid glycosyltransferase YjiC (YdhE family)